MSTPIDQPRRDAIAAAVAAYNAGNPATPLPHSATNTYHLRLPPVRR